jgi:hypothetical protein
MGKQDFVCGVLRLHCVPLRKTNGKTLGNDKEKSGRNDYLRVILSEVEGSHGETGLRLWDPSAPLRSAQDDKGEKAVGMTAKKPKKQKPKLKKIFKLKEKQK